MLPEHNNKALTLKSLPKITNFKYIKTLKDTYNFNNSFLHQNSYDLNSLKSYKPSFLLYNVKTTVGNFQKLNNNNVKHHTHYYKLPQFFQKKPPTLVINSTKYIPYIFHNKTKFKPFSPKHTHVVLKYTSKK
jgi:hypothetical protein